MSKVVFNYKRSSFLKIEEMSVGYQIRTYLGYYSLCIHRQEVVLVPAYNT